MNSNLLSGKESQIIIIPTAWRHSQLVTTGPWYWYKSLGPYFSSHLKHWGIRVHKILCLSTMYVHMPLWRFLLFHASNNSVAVVQFLITRLSGWEFDLSTFVVFLSSFVTPLLVPCVIHHGNTFLVFVY